MLIAASEIISQLLPNRQAVTVTDFIFHQLMVLTARVRLLLTEQRRADNSWPPVQEHITPRQKNMWNK